MPRALTLAHPSAAADGDLVIRPARLADADALADLAALDSARPLSGERVVAEVGGRLVAALSIDDGRAVADPFVGSADAVQILRLHAAAYRRTGERVRRRLPRLVPPRVAPKIA
jgi:hypothetical protein